MSFDIVSKEAYGKTFAISFEDRPDIDVKSIATKRLDEQIERYGEYLRVSALDNYKFAQEIKSKWENRCQRCNSIETINKVDRTRVYGGLLWTESEPMPYKECRKCGEQFEPRFIPIEAVLPQAESRIRYAQSVVEPVEPTNKVRESRL